MLVEAFREKTIDWKNYRSNNGRLYGTYGKPDIVLVDISVRRAIIVDITIPHDDNLVKAEKDKVSKYLDLAHEITAMWNVEWIVIVPIVVSVNGHLAESSDQHLKKFLVVGSRVGYRRQ
ncbi:jg19746 [Pararge aegeria aegeria]|uniref:Jg19746 protein n=1 Tax=Pararge aegeria aegeria TaxID=348720 RepID=A0A8S4RSY3_9NEOP|nr:jg19746 [Pararge aegeria aegeria]